jgi:dihydroorotate dehydrogenase
VNWFRLARPLIHALDAERAHGLAIDALAHGFVPLPKPADEPSLRVALWGLDFPHPIGLAAGFDKDAEAPDALLAQGFGFVEVGSITPKPQPGNAKPRLFRLSEDEAVINRYGFNSKGIEAARARLAARTRRGIVGVNLGKNKETEDAAADYVAGAQALAAHADYLVCNVSSPNTPGLRALQSREALDALVARVQEALADLALPKPPPLLFKIAPDLADADLEDVVRVALNRSLAGLIVGNTTLSRPESLRSAYAKETGGLSGKPLFELSTAVLRKTYRLAGGALPLVGAGGVSDAKTAYAKIRAGATLVQLYSAMVYEGPDLAARIAHALPDLLAADGFARVTDAVGADCR